MRRALPVAVAAVTLLASTLPTHAITPTSEGVGSSKTATSVSERRVKTDFLLSSSAFGSRISGGSIPAGSGETSDIIIGCQRFVGKTKRNYIDSTVVPGLGTIEGVRTKLWTTKVGNKVSSHSLHSIAAITLADTPLGTLAITGIESESEAFNKGGTFGAKVRNTIAGIAYTAPGSTTPVGLAIPAPNQPVEIPGLLKISLGQAIKEVDKNHAAGIGAALRIKVIPSDTVITISRTRTRIERTLTTGLFNGYGAGLEVAVLGDIAQVGKNAYQHMPCMGTDGDNLTNTTAAVDLDPVGATGAAAGLATAKRKGKTAKATTAGVIADVSLLGGALEISVVRGVATVRRLAGGTLVRSAAGSSVGEIVANGTPYTLDALGDLEIPGVAKLDGKVVEKTPQGLKVIGLRVTLLDGSLSVIDLGVAKVGINTRKKN